MASVTIYNCANNKSIPVRPTFANLYKWPESEVEFVKIMNSNNYRDGVEVDHSLSCRQIYLRSYKFSRKKLSGTEKTIKYFNSVKKSVVCASNRLNYNIKEGNCMLLGRAKYVTHAAVSIFHKLISRTHKGYVARHDF
ncbi:hypothetical protein L195_g008486 [Trifolium pratense]|uniref:Uncharacterized protein n=2 Tax=Trifolium pratense TaxID=57577 RepID=A0ACB0KWZ4_TRIPR|nr:hypothetical protein L195_g008486 [Trifolium pratense]CAJ2660789.1 unnamed protein product [Trifolium pratense]